MISSCSSATRSKPISTARSPRAIITAKGCRPAAATMISGRLRTASGVSILPTSGSFRQSAVRRASSAWSAATWAAVWTKE